MTAKKFNQILVITTIIALIMLIVGCFFAWKKLNYLSRTKYENEVVLDKFILRTYSLKNLERSYDSVLPDENKVLYAIPKAKNSERLLADLEKLSQKNGLKLNIYRYMDPKNTGKKKVNAAADLSQSQTNKKEGYSEMPLEITVEGGYLSTYNFVKEVEKSNRLITVKNIEITKVDDGDGGPKDIVKMVVNIVVYIKE